MKHVLSIAAVAITSLLSACATPPAEPTARMRPIENYANMNCQQLNNELGAVDVWEKHHADLNTYMQDQASFMKSIDIFTAALGAVGGAVDQSMSSTYQANSKLNTLSTSQVENSQAQAAAHQAGLAKRRGALGKLMAIKSCS